MIESEDIGIRDGIIGIALAEPGFRLKIRSQAKQTLAQQRSNDLLHSVRAGDRVQAFSRRIGQGELLRKRKTSGIRGFLLLREE